MSESLLFIDTVIQNFYACLPRLHQFVTVNYLFQFDHRLVDRIEETVFTLIIPYRPILRSILPRRDCISSRLATLLLILRVIYSNV